MPYMPTATSSDNSRAQCELVKRPARPEAAMQQKQIVLGKMRSRQPSAQSTYVARHAPPAPIGSRTKTSRAAHSYKNVGEFFESPPETEIGRTERLWKNVRRQTRGQHLMVASPPHFTQDTEQSKQRMIRSNRKK